MNFSRLANVPKDLRYEYTGVPVHIFISVLETITMSKITFFAKSGKNGAVVWRIIDIQPKCGPGMGTLPGYTFMPSLKISYMSAVISKMGSSKGRCYKN